MANFEIFAKGPPFALWPKSPILRTLQKIWHFSSNSCCFIEILVLVETRINSASIHTNQAEIRLVLTILQPFKVWSKKWPISRFLQRVPPLHFGQNRPFCVPFRKFEIFAKGPPFALWPKSPILSTLQKICHLSSNSCCFIEILASVETRINSASIHTNQTKIRLVLTILQPFKVCPKKWPISRFLQRLSLIHI